MDSFNGMDLFKLGQQQQQNSLQMLQAQETAARQQRAQDYLEQQRQTQNAQAEKRAAQAADRDAAIEAARIANLERQQQRDAATEMYRAQQQQGSFMDDYMKYAGNYQKRLDDLGQDLDRLSTRLLPTDQALQNKLYQEAQYYQNVVAPSLSKVGNIPDINAAINQALGTTPLEKSEHIKAIIAPVWLQLQKEGIRDANTINQTLAKALAEDVAARNPERNNETIKARMEEIQQERNRLNAILQGSGMFNRMMNLQEFATFNKSPFAMMGQMDASQLSPPQTSKKQHFASGMAMIGTMKDGKPVHINPQSWGGTVTSEDGRVQIVPSVHATISDALMIERLNQTGGKALAHPVIEDDVDIPMTEPKAAPQKSPNLNQQVSEKVNQEQLAMTKQVETALDQKLTEVATGFGQLMVEFKKNPAIGLTYDQVLGALSANAKEIANSQGGQVLHLTPQIVYQKLVEKLPQFGLKALPGRENKNQTLQDVINLGNNYNDFYEQKLGKLQGAKSNQLTQDILSNPWVRGTWNVPNNYDDLVEYARRRQVMSGQQ